MRMITGKECDDAHDHGVRECDDAHDHGEGMRRRA
jgi:hypothetical protein